MEQIFVETEAGFGSDGDVSLNPNWKSTSAETKISDSGSTHECFDCNICLDSAQEPIVTFCGHLYCWPCIYKWLHVRIASDHPQQQKKCPVCNADISLSSLVPLYGRGLSHPDSEAKKPQLGLVVPPRPPPFGLNALNSSSATNPNQHHASMLGPAFQHQHYFHNLHPVSAASYLGDTTMTSLINPTIGMFGEMVFTTMFGTSDAALFPHPYPNSYPITGNTSPRIRRQEMQLDKSLGRVSLFFFCCFVLCLLLF